MTDLAVPLTGSGFAEIRAVDELTLYYRNPKIGNVDAIAESLTTNLQYKPIVVNRGTMTGRRDEVLAGNHTLLAARKLSWPAIQTWSIDVDEQTAARINAVDNRAADLGSYDEAVLIAQLQSVDSLEGTGYSEADLLKLLGNQAQPGNTDPDELPDTVTVPAVTQAGDVWLLGPHRIACGSAIDEATYSRVMRDDLADMIWTDPPYGVDYVGKTKDSLRISNDDLGGLPGLLQAAFGHMVRFAKPGTPVYIAHAEATRTLNQAAIEAAEIKFRQTLIWVKNTIVLGHSDYHYSHEPIAYGFTQGPGRPGRGGPRWYGNDSQSSTLFFDKPGRSAEHPTMKPVALIDAMLANSLPAGGLVLDPFAGSGSTLIAAHQRAGQARLIELEPRYVDVTCRRFQDFTGMLPVREAGGEVDFTKARHDG